MSQLILPGASEAAASVEGPHARGPQPGMGLDDSIYNRLLKDRILFLGPRSADENANAICAQLLLLAAEDPDKDIYLYINSPGGSVTAGMAIYDTMQFASSRMSPPSRWAWRHRWASPAFRGRQGETVRLATRAGHDAPAVGRFGGTASDIKIQAELIKHMKEQMAGRAHRGETRPIGRDYPA